MITIHLYRPEPVDQLGVGKLARNYRAINDPLTSLPALMERLRKHPEDRWIALESRAEPSVSIHDYDWVDVAARQDIRLVTGSTNHGLPKVVLDQMHDFLHVPQYPDVPFLAPHTALAVTLHEYFRVVHNTNRVFG
jgi:tRNA(Leu) C34 or U34 (ribose-2'-O)-methylase TrmL